MKSCLALFLFGLLSADTLAYSLQLPAEELHVRRLTVRDGLPSAYVNKVIQRQNGFIWFGTKGGLSRFDGKNFLNFQISSASGLVSNDVLSLLEDQQQRLWIGTARGLFLYNDNSQQFKQIDLTPNLPVILSLFQDPENQLWVGTDQGVFLLAANGEVVRHYAPELEVKVMLSYQGQLWLGSKQGLFLVDEATNEVTEIPLQGAAEIDIRHKRIFDAVITEGKFYLATDRDGLLLFDPSSRQVARQWLTADELRSNSVWSLAKHGDQLWLGYFYDGISSLSLLDGSITHYQHHPQIQYSLPHNNISQLYVDKQQQLWIATTNGLAVTNLADQAIRHLGEYQQISNKHIWSTALIDNSLWFGSEDGLNRYNLQQNQLTVFASGDAPGQLPRTVIWAMQPLEDDLLLATNQGLLAFTMTTGNVRRWPAPTWQQPGQNTEVYSLRRHQQQLLLGYYRGHFAVYDLASQQYVHHSQLDQANYITDVLPIDSGYLLATDTGLYQVLAGETKPLTELLPELATQSLHITSLLQVGTEIWAGTQDNGLLILAFASGQWQLRQQLGLQDGLAENQLRALALASDGQVWLTGMKTLSKIDPETLTVRRLSHYLHWLDMEFHANASLKQAGNFLAFGGNQGLIFFNGNALQEKTAFPAVHLTAAQLMTEQVSIDNEQLYVPPHASYYAFQFAALDYFSPERIKYQYQLQPLMNSWQPMLNNQLSLSSLPYGEYRLKVRSTNAEGVWSDSSKAITLVLTAPWYLSLLAKWIYAVVGMILLVTVLSWLLFRFRKLKKVANHDALTGLPNRRFFKYELQQRLQLSRNSQQQLALLFFDLNRFKQLNDNWGHEAGDQLLIQVAARLTQAIRATDFAARLAGDEFVVILSHIQQLQELESTVQRISNSLCQHYQLGQMESFQLSCSIGISIYNSQNPVTADMLLQQADTAMYQSKQQQLSWCYYNSEVATSQT